MPIPDSPVELPGFRISSVFKSFLVFAHNWTRLKAGSQLNRSDRPVQSLFKTMPVSNKSNKKTTANQKKKKKPKCRAIYENNMSHLNNNCSNRRLIKNTKPNMAINTI